MKLLFIFTILFVYQAELALLNKKEARQLYPIKPILDINLIDVLQPLTKPPLIAINEINQGPVLSSAYTNNDRYCCKIDIPIITNSYYKLNQYTYQGSQVVQTGTTDCGLFGWSNCGVYATQYFTSIAYRQDLIVEYRLGTCPTEHVVCCNGFILVNGQCLNIATEVNGK